MTRSLIKGERLGGLGAGDKIRLPHRGKGESKYSAGLLSTRDSEVAGIGILPTTSLGGVEIIEHAGVG